MIFAFLSVASLVALHLPLQLLDILRSTPLLEQLLLAVPSLLQILARVLEQVRLQVLGVGEALGAVCYVTVILAVRPLLQTVVHLLLVDVYLEHMLAQAVLASVGLVALLARELRLLLGLFLPCFQGGTFSNLRVVIGEQLHTILRHLYLEPVNKNNLLLPMLADIRSVLQSTEVGCAVILLACDKLLFCSKFQ